MPFFFSKRAAARLDVRGHIQQRDQALYYPLPAPHNGKMSSSDTARDIDLFPGDFEILSAEIAGITSAIKQKRWTATQVLYAYVRSARRSQIRTNALAEVFIEQALQRAAELDRIFEETGELVGPLHGVPISIKDMLKYKGTKQSCGLAALIPHPPDEMTASTAAVLESLGAVLYVKTNVPQGLMTFETVNYVFGRSLNPWNTNFTPGGSSGGESALIASDGSAAGVGSDSAGSLRIPSHHTGLYTIKGSPNRWAYGRMCTILTGLEAIKSIVGPMCRTAADCELLYLEVIRAHLPPQQQLRRDRNDPAVLKEAAEHDTTLAKFWMSDAFRNDLNEAWLSPLGVAAARGSPLRIGYVVGDGIYRTTPAVYRAVMESVAALQAKYPSREVEIIQIPPERLQILEVMPIFLRTLTSEGYSWIDKYLSSEPGPIPQIRLVQTISRLPGILRNALAFIFKYIVRDRIYASFVSYTGRCTAREVWENTERRVAFSKQWNARLWDEMKLDAYIAPTQACPAVPHDGAVRNSTMVGSTVLCNITEAVVANLPVLRVDPSKDSHKPADYVNAPVEDQKAFARWQSEAAFKNTSKICNYNLYNTAYDAHKMAGLPVGLQVVCRPYHEEKAIGIMRLLDNALPPLAERGGFWKNKTDILGNAIPESKQQTFYGFGPGKLTQALFAERK
ncbi:hypothetical protein AJ79_06355 [Helicocarpus griseus UAMH5409]|uniref:amidase n=1 Tax=Helicocarpus griseus UAMH5409 TaxID=1447875 RepID=A0A2B7XEI8_9EURO|nr:hypothetical protein AJ79_06355 [Helicocarpus griseus UAMH5409]